MEGAGWYVYEEDIIMLTFMRDLPGLQHHKDLGMASIPSMSQQEYERNILAIGSAADHADDDNIKIICPGEVDGDVTRTMMMKRSSLKRSNPLNKFFESKYYRYGCGMALHFTEVPGVAFGLVKIYLEDGPDRFTQEKMMCEVSKSYLDTGKRMETYTRLHKCARLLELHGLKNMALMAIRTEEGGMAPEHCMSLASFIFASQGGFGQELKNWLMGHIKNNFEALRANPIMHAEPETTWNNLVSNLSPTFKKDWKIIVNAHARAQIIQVEAHQLSPVNEEEDEQDHQYLQGFQSANNAEMTLAVEESSKFKEAPQDKQEGSNTVIDSLGALSEDGNQAKANKEGSEGREDVDQGGLATAVHHSAKNTKENPPRSETPDAEVPRHRSLDLQNNKARQVLGINSPSGSAIASRRKGPGLTRAAKSLTNLMRSPSTQGLDDLRHP